MEPAVQKIVDSAMAQAAEFGVIANVRAYALTVLPPGTPAETTEPLREEKNRFVLLYDGALSVLAHVLDAAGYDVRIPAGSEGAGLPSIRMTEGELKKWRADHPTGRKIPGDGT